MNRNDYYKIASRIESKRFEEFNQNKFIHLFSMKWKKTIISGDYYDNIGIEKAILILIFLITVLSGFSQDSLIVECNRSVKISSFLKKMPNEVCLPKGNYQVTHIFENTDINEDGYDDFIFKYSKYPLTDGDTSYISVYTQNSDSSFSFFRTFDNLYPLYFLKYDIEFIPKDERLRLIHKKYENEYLLLNLEFNKNRIIIKRKMDAEFNLIITYKYNKELNNWVYEKCEEFLIAHGISTPYDLQEKLGPTIDNFTYFIWD